MSFNDNINLHPGCILCKQRNVAKADTIDQETGRIIARKGDFVIQCKGIPADPIVQITEAIDQAGLSHAVDEDDIVSLAMVKDPVLWAAENVTVLDEETGGRGPWLPQGATSENIERYKLDPSAAYYQELMVKCTARRQLARLGRRSGKSWTITIKALHKMMTSEGYRILVITPNISQLDLIFDRINDFIDNSPGLKGSKQTYRKTPQRFLQLANKSYMTGFVSGNSAIRGQAADMIIIDEADYLTTDDLSAITAILTEHRETILLVASTPTGKREQFYKWDHDPVFRSFHFPSMCRPKWDENMEIEQKKELPGTKFLHEILSEYGDITEGVFQHNHIDRAVEQGDYDYGFHRPDDDWIYCMGVDWNPVHGTEIVVVGLDPNSPTLKYKTVDCGQVYREGNTQTQAIMEIVELNQKWRPEHIYVDRGAGSVQIELLQQLGSRAHPSSPDKRLETIVKAIDFGSKLDMRHPVEGTIMRTYAKPAIVENAIRLMEADQIVLSKFDSNLIRATRGFIIDKIGANGRPSYKMVNDDIEDHRLDAWLLALFAFTMEYSKLGVPQISTSVGFTGLFGEAVMDVSATLSVPDRGSSVPKPRDIQSKISKDQRLEIEKERELNFIPTSTIIETSWVNGERAQRIVHKVAPREEPNKFSRGSSKPGGSRGSFHNTRNTFHQ